MTLAQWNMRVGLPAATAIGLLFYASDLAYGNIGLDFRWGFGGHPALSWLSVASLVAGVMIQAVLALTQSQQIRRGFWISQATRLQTVFLGFTVLHATFVALDAAVWRTGSFEDRHSIMKVVTYSWIGTCWVWTMIGYWSVYRAGATPVRTPPPARPATLPRPAPPTPAQASAVSLHDPVGTAASPQLQLTFEVARGSRAAGTVIAQLPFPDDATLRSISRAGRTIDPQRTTILAIGDRVVVDTQAGHVAAIQAIFQ